MHNEKPLQPAAEVRSRREKKLRSTTFGAAIAGPFPTSLSHAQVPRVEPSIGADITGSSVFSNFNEAAAFVGLHHRFH